MTLAELRKGRNMTQTDLAKQIGITQQSVQAIESGNSKPSIAVAKKVKCIFDLTIEQVWGMFYDDDKEG